MELIVIGLIYLVGGPFVVKTAIAVAERHYLHRAQLECYSQAKMDRDDWVGAMLFAGLAFALTPLSLVAMALAGPAKAAWQPVRRFFLPPTQRAHEEHVAVLDSVKQQGMRTAKTLHEVKRFPSGPDTDALRSMLRSQLRDQLDQLRSLIDQNSDFDQEYLKNAETDIDSVEMTGRPATTHGRLIFEGRKRER